MWPLFFLSIFLGALLLYIPGFFMVKSLRLPSFFSLLFAPCVTILFYCILAIIYEKCGIFCTWYSLFFPVLLLGLLLCGIRAIIAKKRAARDGKIVPFSLRTWFTPDRRFKLFAITLYLIVGISLGTAIYVRALDGPDSFSQAYDNMYHLAVIQTFADSGNYSSLSASDIADINMSSGSYYPAAFHLLAASIMDLTGISNTMASNCVDFILCFIVFPTNCLLFLSVTFPESKRTILSGSIVCLAFLAFPWYFLIWGKLSANLFSFVLIPSCLTAFMLIFRREIFFSQRIYYGIAFSLGVFSSFFTHPNGLFALIVFLFPFCIHLICSCRFLTSKLAKLLCTLGLLITVSTIWMLAYEAPFLQGIVSFSWVPQSGKAQAIIDIILSSTSFTPAQIPLGILIIAGLFFIIRNWKNMWLLGTAAVVCFLYWIDASTDNSIRQLLVGFWYTDPFRTSALVALTLYPIASFGLSSIWQYIDKHVRKNHAGHWVRLLFIVFLFASLFYPSFQIRGIVDINTPFGFFYGKAVDFYRSHPEDDTAIFDGKEQDFIEKARAIVGEDIVANTPYDGSVYAYQTQDMRTLFRSITPLDASHDPREIIRSKLVDYLADDNVREAVSQLDIKYVLLLNQGTEPYTSDWPLGEYPAYKGIDSINDETPGFEVVLSDGDMRLYRITQSE